METVDVEFEEKCRIVAGLSMAEMHFKIHQDGTLRLVMDDISMPAGGCVAGGDLEPAAYSNFPILDRIAVATEEAIQKEINYTEGG